MASTSRKYEEPFTFTDGLAYLGIPFNTGTKNPNILCPACGKKDFYFDITRNYGHCYRASCNFKANQISYMAVTLGISNKEVVELMQKADRNTSMYQYTMQQIYEPIAAADPSIRNIAYTELIKQMPLSVRHTNDMLARGLTNNQLLKLNYGSYKWKESIARNIQRKGISIKGVAGFYSTETSWLLKKQKEGIMVPYLNEFHKICGIQIRKNDESLKIIDGKKEKKYTWLTSNGCKDGAKVEGCYHFACDWCMDISTKRITPIIRDTKALLTEGGMKADISHAVTGEFIVAIPGVSNTIGLRHALSYLKSRGITEIVDILDMDYLTNENVQIAMAGIKKLIQEMGFIYTRRNWEVHPEKGVNLKGYDDYVVYKHRLSNNISKQL